MRHTSLWVARRRALFAVGAWLAMVFATPAWAALAEARTLAFVPGVRFGSEMAFHLEQRPDGTATLVAGSRRYDATWTDDGTALTVTYLAPQFQYESAELIEGVVYRQNFFETGRVFRRVQGSLELGRADTVPLSHFVWIEGPLTGQVVTVSDANSPAQPVQARKPGLRLPLDASEFPVGAQWAGVITVPAPTADPFDVNLKQDVLRVVTDRRASGTDDIQRMTWRVRANALSLTRPTDTGAVQLRYWRMGVHADNGTEHWMLTVIDASGVVQAFDCLVARVDTSTRFTPGGIEGEWYSTFSTLGASGGLSDGDEIRFRFFSDRSADHLLIESDGDVSPATPINAWEIQRSGTRMQLFRPSTANLSYVRWWQPVRRTGDWLVTMERLDYRRIDTGAQVIDVRRLGAYRYLGPAVR